jgi:hypothetical protein
LSNALAARPVTLGKCDRGLRDPTLRRQIEKNWRARTGSNRQPSVSKTDTLSS